MKFVEIRDVLERSGLQSAKEALSKIQADNMAEKLPYIECEKLIAAYENLSLNSKNQKQAVEAKEFVANLKCHQGASGCFLQFETGKSGLDFILFLLKSGKVIGCVRTGVLTNA